MIEEPSRHDPDPSLLRFDRIERLTHRLIAILMLICIGSAAVLYNGSLALLIGHRQAVRNLHVYCGLALPLPLLAALSSAAYRADLSRLNRFTEADWRWLRARNRRDGTIVVGKFNAGQKLNASLSAGAIGVLLGTGVIMHFPDLVRLSWRTGATFVHDWFALALGLLVLGHVVQAARDPEARRGMRHGSVRRSWARREHGHWADELDP
jgi:formate dehydrogenase subunit gamma